MHVVGGWFSRLKARLRTRGARPAARVPARPPFRRKYLVEALEPRLLMSADLPVVPPPVPDPLPVVDPIHTVAASAGGDASPDQFHFDASALAADFATPIAPDAPAPEAAAEPTEIAFVDSRVVGQDALAIQRDGMLVVVLDSNQDGVAQISEVLAQHHDIKAVHILAHGDAGEMFLGNSVLDAQAVQDGKVAAWGKALTQEGDVLLYGCNVAEGGAGQSFVQQLAAATGADVGASVDATGNAAQGGNWSLEYTIGMLETSPLSSASLDRLLATVNGTASNDTLVFGTDFTWGDIVDGKAGTDILNFSSATTALTFTITGANSFTVSDAMEKIYAANPNR